MPPNDALDQEAVENTKTVISVLPGRTLVALLSEEAGKLDDLLPIFLRILRLLDSMHNSGLDHHWLSPASIRLDANDRPTIHTRSEPAADSQTVPVIESKHALPESFWEGTENQPCATSDSYLLGFIFYELLLGRQRFKAQFNAVESGPASAWLSWHADRSRKPLPLSELLPNFPVSLSRLIGEMTEKDPRHRISNFTDIIKRLERAGEDTAFVKTLPAEGDTTTAFNPAKNQLPDRKGRRKGLISIFGESKPEQATAGSLHRRKCEGNDESTTKLDDFLQRVEERRAAAKRIAERASELEKNGAVAEALKQWTSIRDIYPNFPDLEFHLKRLRSLLPEVPEQGEHTARIENPSDTSLHSKRALLEHVFADRKQQPQSRNKGAAWIAAFLFAAALLTLALWAHYRGSAAVSPLQQIPVELQANVSKAEFTVDGKRVLSTFVNLAPGSHRAEAWAEGYESASKMFTVSEGASNTVLFNLQSNLPSLNFRTPIKDVKYILDGDDPADLENGVLTEEHMVSGHHTFQILKDNKQIFSLEFQIAPRRVTEVGAHTASEDTSAFILSSFQDSAKLYATPDWKVTLGNGSSQTGLFAGLDLPPQKIGKPAVTAESADGEIIKLSADRSKMPSLNILLKSLPEKVPVTLFANVSNPTVVLNGHPLNIHLRRGYGVLWLLPGTHKIKLIHRNYYDSTEETVNTKRSPEDPPRIQFELTRLNRNPNLLLDSGLSDAEFQVDGEAVAPSKVKDKLTLPLDAGHHVITIKKKNFEEYSLARDFVAGEAVSLNPTGMRALSPVSFKANPSSAIFQYQQGNNGPATQIANGATVTLPAGEYFVSASASGFETAKQKISVESGNPVTINLTLTPVVKGSNEKLAHPSLPNLFNAADDWHKDDEGWWVHNNPGYAFLGRSQGSFLLAIRRPEHRFFSRNKKVTFVVNYKGENNCILYSLDEHTLHRRVFPEGSSQSEYRKHHNAWEEAYVLRIAITPEKAVLQDRNGNILDSLPLASGKDLGKIGFLGPVALRAEAH